MNRHGIAIPEAALAEFCRKWRVRELAFFGSVLREDFHPGSDVDVLVDYEPGARHDLCDHWSMQEELAEVFGRKVDLVSTESYEKLKAELVEKERALADQAVELTILRKKTNGGSWDR